MHAQQTPTREPVSLWHPILYGLLALLNVVRLLVVVDDDDVLGRGLSVIGILIGLGAMAYDLRRRRRDRRSA